MADLNKLRAVLNNSAIQVKNPALYQVISEMLTNLIALGASLASSRNRDAPPFTGQESFVTSEAEPSLPEHRKLTAGTNITLVDDALNNLLTIAAAGGGGGGGGLEYLGDYVTPHTYNDGDIVIAADGIAYVCTVNNTTTPPEPWPGIGVAINATVDATYWVVSAHPQLVNERVMSILANGYVKSTAGEPSTIALIPLTDTTGTLPDNRLTSNVALKNIDNLFSAAQTLPSYSFIKGDLSLFYFSDINAGVNQKLWRFLNYHNGNLVLEAMNDANNATLATFTFGRDGQLYGGGGGLTNLNAAALATGVANPARLGTGTPSTSTFLRGDGTWATIGGVPQGAVIFFDAPCPPGYTRVGPWDTYYVRMNSSHSAGGSSTHSHTPGSFAAPAHTHDSGSLSIPSHNHGGSTGNVTVGFGITISGTTGGGGGHDHTFSGTTGGESNGAMNVDGGASGNMTRSPHTHGFSGTTSNEPNHTHSFSGSGSGSGSGTGSISSQASAGVNGNTGSAGGGAVTGTSSVANNLPLYVDFFACKKD